MIATAGPRRRRVIIRAAILVGNGTDIPAHVVRGSAPGRSRAQSGNGP